ncbi:MAG TPA: hypothetical protein VMC79_15215 [Rectinemataceae bacterium]|nr:hypothetical protein [Rectinemataceae bacterium]
MKYLLFSAVLALCLVLSACTTTDHAVHVAPVSVSIPVSASSLYATDTGAVKSGQDYDILDHFRFTRDLKGPIGVKGYVSNLDISSELAQRVAMNKADAIVNLRILPEKYDPGNSYAVGGFKIAGGMFLGFGAMFGLLSLTMSDSSGDDPLGPMALVFGGLGGAGLVVSSVMRANGSTTWTIAVEGDLVKAR